jgi:hypothetical protein
MVFILIRSAHDCSLISKEIQLDHAKFVMQIDRWTEKVGRHSPPFGLKSDIPFHLFAGSGNRISFRAVRSTMAKCARQSRAGCVNFFMLPLANQETFSGTAKYFNHLGRHRYLRLQRTYLTFEDQIQLCLLILCISKHPRSWTPPTAATSYRSPTSDHINTKHPKIIPISFSIIISNHCSKLSRGNAIFLSPPCHSKPDRHDGT